MKFLITALIGAVIHVIHSEIYFSIAGENLL